MPFYNIIKADVQASAHTSAVEKRTTDTEEEIGGISCIQYLLLYCTICFLICYTSTSSSSVSVMFSTSPKPDIVMYSILLLTP